MRIGHNWLMEISKAERRRRLDAINELVQRGLIRVVRIVDGEPCYLITGDVEREPPRDEVRRRDPHAS